MKSAWSSNKLLHQQSSWIHCQEMEDETWRSRLCLWLFLTTVINERVGVSTINFWPHMSTFCITQNLDLSPLFQSEGYRREMPIGLDLLFEPCFLISTHKQFR
jgi:hypothetical protein